MNAGIGSFGGVVFEVSAKTVRTFDEYRRTRRAVYADHETMFGKPASEFTGLELDEVAFAMTFNAALGVVPDAEVAVLDEMLRSGSAHMLVIGSRPRGSFTIRQVTENFRHVLRGAPVVVEVDVVLKEYDDGGAGTGAAAGGGADGPRKVPGAKAPLQRRQLTARE